MRTEPESGELEAGENRGSWGGSRTLTLSPELDFESSASTSFATQPERPYSGMDGRRMLHIPPWLIQLRAIVWAQCSQPTLFFRGKKFEWSCGHPLCVRVCLRHVVPGLGASSWVVRCAGVD